MVQVIAGIITVLLFLFFVTMQNHERIENAELKLSNKDTKFCKVLKEKSDTIILECNK